MFAVSDHFPKPEIPTEPRGSAWILEMFLVAAAVVLGFAVLRQIVMAVLWAAIGFGIYACCRAAALDEEQERRDRARCAFGPSS